VVRLLGGTTPVRQSGPVPRLIQPLFMQRTYAELLYVALGLPLGIAGFVFVVTTLSVSVGLMITVIGFPLLAFTLVLAKQFGAVERGLGRGLLGVQVDTPRPQPRTKGLLSFLTDRAGWRAMTFLLLRFPVAIFDFTVTTVVWSYGLAGTTYWFWRHFLPIQHDSHHVAHRGSQLGTNYFIDTHARITVTTIVGVLVLIAAPWVVHGVLTLDRLLIRGLLGPSTAAERVRELETTRAMAVEDSAASLRRIERDLHDGAQARLVALAMSLGLAKEELDGDDPASLARVRQLVDAAHREAKGTIVDLRDLARGIHPPALDNGLPDALATLTARCAIPVSLHVALDERPSAAVESIVYFCTAELLTNVVKHSGARRASVNVVRGEHRLVVRVEDDGAGGAATGRGGGSGLIGLIDRVATVDGTLAIVSPEGGPTTMTIEVPL
jgi:signal transduction histidine kinase